MKFCYGYRRSAFYPYQGDAFPFPDHDDVRAAYLRTVGGMGFDGIELPGGAGGSGSEQATKDLGKELADAGIPCVSVRGGGGLHSPRAAAANRQHLEASLRFAAAIGASVLNTTVGTGHQFPDGPGSGVGEPLSQGGSRTASTSDFERTAQGLREIADQAADLGIQISIEVHQHSISDTSWAALHLLDLIDRPNVGANPDLGNILWTYDIPEESSEAAIVALAPRANYWHCKNLKRVHIPENKHSIFLRVPLPDGDIDYRFAIAAMLDAKFDGYLVIEGMRLGDQLDGDARSLAYARQIIADLS